MNNEREYDVLLEQILKSLNDLERKYKCRSYEIVDFVNQSSTYNYYYKDVSLLKSHTKKHFHSSAKREKLKDFAGALEKMLVIKEEENTKITFGDREVEVMKVVHTGIGYGFDLYLSLPDISLNLEQLKITHLAETSAFKRLKETVQQKSEHGWILSNPGNPSQYKIIDTVLLDIKPNLAHVRTKEYWLLSWFNPNTQEYIYEYESEDEHTYILSWQLERGWMIETHNQDRPSAKVHPKIFKPEIYEDIPLKKSFLIQKVEQFIGSGNLESGLEIVYAFGQKLEKRSLNLDLITLRGSLYSLMKQLNLNQISLNEYQSAKRSIARELYQLVDELIMELSKEEVLK